MSPPAPSAPLPGQACQVLPADAVFVCLGVNMGDGLLEPADKVCPGDYLCA